MYKLQAQRRDSTTKKRNEQELSTLIALARPGPEP
jgi:hypothetical protein